MSGFLCVGPESSSVHSTVSRTSSCIKFGSAFGGRLTQDQETQTDEVESTATESAQLELLRLSSMLAELQSQVIGMPACNEEESGARATVQPRLFGISVMKNNPFDLELPGFTSNDQFSNAHKATFHLELMEFKSSAEFLNAPKSGIRFGAARLQIE